jgi:hypothetical protein
MLSLDSPRWGELEHAYGSAADVPALLVTLLAFPKSEGQREPWFSIWSALAHQGDVYFASFAAVPHVISVLALDPMHCDSAYFQFPAWVEICRVSKNVPVPTDLQQAYFDALASLPVLAARWAAKVWSDSDLVCVLSAIAAVKGHPAIAEAVIEMTDLNAADTCEWLREQ